MLIRIVRASRFLVLLPIIGLSVASAVLFAIGGIGLFTFVLESIGHATVGDGEVEILPIYELLEFVHQFLIGTVLYITAVGLYQLFIQKLQLPGWMRTESAEDLEINLIGVTVVVLAIEFLGVVVSGIEDDLLNYGAGIALPIAALGIFLAAKHIAHRQEHEDKSQVATEESDTTAPAPAEDAAQPRER
jgi:uncharacterized membrane protein YqhA